MLVLLVLLVLLLLMMEEMQLLGWVLAVWREGEMCRFANTCWLVWWRRDVRGLNGWWERGRSGWRRLLGGLLGRGIDGFGGFATFEQIDNMAFRVADQQIWEGQNCT